MGSDSVAGDDSALIVSGAVAHLDYCLDRLPRADKAKLLADVGHWLLFRRTRPGVLPRMPEPEPAPDDEGGE